MKGQEVPQCRRQASALKLWEAGCPDDTMRLPHDGAPDKTAFTYLLLSSLCLVPAWQEAEEGLQIYPLCPKPRWPEAGGQNCSLCIEELDDLRHFVAVGELPSHLDSLYFVKEGDI